MKISGLPFLMWLKEERLRTNNEEVRAALLTVEAMAHRYEVGESYEVGLKSYNAKLDEFYKTTGRPALEMALKLHRGGATYGTIANELELAGYLTVNGHSKWSTAQIRRYVLRLERTEEQNTEDSIGPPWK